MTMTTAATDRPDHRSSTDLDVPAVTARHFVLAVVALAMGGFAIGITEALAAGYLSSAYKDAVAFAIILLVLTLRPRGLLGRAAVERV